MIKNFFTKEIYFFLFLSLVSAVITLSAGAILLSVSGWFIAASAKAGLNEATRFGFNYLFPAAVIRMLSITRTFFRWADRVVGHEVTFRLITKIRSFSFAQILNFSYLKRQKYRTSELFHSFLEDIQSLDNFYLRFFMPIFLSFFACFLVFFVLLNVSFLYFLLLVSFLLFLIFLYFVCFVYLSYKQEKNLAKTKKHFRISLLDIFNNYKELQVYQGLENYYEKIFLEQSKLFLNELQILKTQAFAKALYSFLTCLFLFVCLFVLTNDASFFTNPKSAVLVFLTLAIFEILSTNLLSYNLFLRSFIGFNNLKNIGIFGKNNPKISTKKLFLDKEDLVLQTKDISFFYRDKKILEKINFKISKKEKIAIIGASGCGKSTFFSLLQKRLEPQNGNIFINKIDLKEINNKDFAKYISSSLQSPHIFSASLRFNLAFDKNISNEKLKEYLDIFELDYLYKIQGLDANLSSDEISLSGGEIKRISIIRSLIVGAKLLLLDEVTEGLDPVLEYKILNYLLNLDVAIIFITHRKTLLNKADKIYKIQNHKLSQVFI